MVRWAILLELGREWKTGLHPVFSSYSSKFMTRILLISISIKNHFELIYHPPPSISHSCTSRTPPASTWSSGAASMNLSPIFVTSWVFLSSRSSHIHSSNRQTSNTSSRCPVPSSWILHWSLQKMWTANSQKSQSPYSLTFWQHNTLKVDQLKNYKPPYEGIQMQ